MSKIRESILCLLFVQSLKHIDESMRAHCGREIRTLSRGETSAALVRFGGVDVFVVVSHVQIAWKKTQGKGRARKKRVSNSRDKKQPNCKKSCVTVIPTGPNDRFARLQSLQVREHRHVPFLRAIIESL